MRLNLWRKRIWDAYDQCNLEGKKKKLKNEYNKLKGVQLLTKPKKKRKKKEQNQSDRVSLYWFSYSSPFFIFFFDELV